jgi:methyl coenzyme M reductase beta subunit
MASTLPFKTAIGIGIESTRGTAVARTNWVEVQSAEFTETATYERFPVMQAVWGGSRQVSHITTKQVVGTLTVPLQYQGIGILLKNLMGAVATTGSSPGPYTHLNS